MDQKRASNGNKLIAVAKRNLSEMRAMFASQHYYGTVNRAYYAMFHAVSALLLRDGLRFKKHMNLISAFGRAYAKTGVVPREYHQLLNQAYETRNKADYDVDMIIDYELAELYCQKAEELVAFIEQKIHPKDSFDGKEH
ncbi:MAG: HEPN domain-containing protein [candidate division KSB1 bacterium]